MSDLQLESINSIESDISQNRLIASYQDHSVRLFSLEDTSLNLLHTLKSHSSPVISSFFINHGEYLASVDLSGLLIIWQLNNDKYVVFKEIKLDVSLNCVCYLMQEKGFKIFFGLVNGEVISYLFDENFNYESVEVLKMKTGIVSMSCNSKRLVVCDEIGVHDGTFYKLKGVRSVCVVNSNYFDIDSYLVVSEDGIFIDKDRQKIEMKDCVSCKWSMAGFSFTVGMANGSVKAFAPNSDGFFEEIEIEKIE
ncbi:DNA polymerase alpha accessory factor Mcl1 [Gurleya vavrai]